MWKGSRKPKNFQNDMSGKRLEFKVGLFVFIGLGLLAVLLLQFSKGVRFFHSYYTIQLHAPDVGGLKPRAMVLMSGVQIGSVGSIQLTEDGKSVDIMLEIYKQYKIYSDARFTIEQAGFLGDQYVAILPTKNEGKPLENGATAQAEAPFNIQEVARSASGFVQRIDETAKRLNEALVDVRKYVLNTQTLTNLAVTVQNLRDVSDRALGTVESLDQFIRTNEVPLTQSSSNLLTFSSQLTDFGNRLNGLVATNSPRIDAAVENVAASTETLRTLVKDLEAGKGLAGNVLRNEELSSSVSQIANNLSITSSNLNRLGLWGILWSHKPPRTNTFTGEPIASPKAAGL